MFVDIIIFRIIISMKNLKSSGIREPKSSYSLSDYREMLINEKSSKRDRNGKYNAIRTTFDGINFDSKGECERYKQLKLLEEMGQIKNLQLKVVHKLELNGVHICNYESDFEYDDNTGKHIVEDYKGFRTKEFKIKSKLMLALNGVEILETGSKGGAYGRAKRCIKSTYSSVCITVFYSLRYKSFAGASYFKCRGKR